MRLANIDTAFLQDDNRTVRHDLDILVQGGEIVAVAPDLSDQTGHHVIDCHDQIAVPGLVNCHAHTAMQFARGLSDDEPLFEWLATNGTYTAVVDRDTKRAACRLATRLMLERGVTTVHDMWNTYLADEFTDLGIRAVIGSTMAENEPSSPSKTRPRLEKTREAIAAFAGRPTLHPSVPVHSVYRATPELLQAAHDLAADADIPFHIHVAENATEVRRCRDVHGTTPVGVLDQMNVLDEHTVAVHCTELTNTDRERLGAAKAGVAHCPSANLKLGSGVANVSAVPDDVAVGIGTDGAGSNNDLAPLREARLATLLQKQEDPAAVDAQYALDMMTREGAAVLGLEDRLGSLLPGHRADITLFDSTDPALTPAIGDAGLLSNLVYSFHGHAETVLVEGRVVVDDGRCLTDTGDAAATVETFQAEMADSEGRTPYRRS
ncbi:MAG: cytosine deaminase related metal-dependent hydrolase [halophilic archaeon J07HX5]|nr:MAG: cytosine deaminase related metal-dependent hydrolase [halophilic archaeon J07HX5]